MTKLTGKQIAAERLTGWVLLAGGLRTRIHSGDFATGLALANAIGRAAEEMNHHPDLDLRYAHLDVRLSSHDVNGVTERDVRLARTISGLVAVYEPTSLEDETDAVGTELLERVLSGLRRL